MVECGVEKAAMCFVMQAYHVGFRHLCGRMIERVKAEVNEDSNLLISGGMTKLLQPLDFVINRPLKVMF
jgi:pantothenate kinase type III